MAHDFDVFLSYNTTNRPFVQALYDELARWEVRSWIDVKQIDPGDTILEKIETGLRTSRTIAVLVGAEGFGRYQAQEKWAAIQSAVERGVRVIPVLLPGYNQGKEDQLPSFLAVKKWVQFNVDPSERAPLEELVRATLKDAGDDRLARFLKTPPPAADPVRISPTSAAAAIRPGASRSDVDDAIGELTSAVKRFGTLTVFVGAGTGEPRPYEIAKQLLTDLRFIEVGYGALLPSMEAAASYYEIDQPHGLETRVVDLISATPGTQQQPRLHSLIAKLIARMRAIGGDPTRRRQAAEPPLIVTTALDLMIERALLREGVPFTRIVQHWSGDKVTINEYTDVALQGDNIVIGPPGDTDSVSQSDSHALDMVIEQKKSRVVRAGDETLGTMQHPIRDLALSQFQTPGQPPRPILYKYHGSQDVPGSCALSTDQYFRLAVRRAIPDRLVEMIGNTTALFFPCGALDADVRHAYQTLLRRAYLDGRDGLPRYAVVRPPSDPEPDSYRQLEMRMWPRVIDAVQRQMQIKVLETNPEAFVSDLADRLS